MAEGYEREPQTVNVFSSNRQEDIRNYPGSNFIMLGRRPMSDSSITYEENAFHDSPDVKLVRFTERRNSLSTQGTSSDGDGGNSSDDGSKPSTSRATTASTKSQEQSYRVRSIKGTKTTFDCDCPQSQKAKRKAAKKLSTLSTPHGSVPVLTNGKESSSRPRKKNNAFMNRVKRLFCDSGSPTNSDEPPFPTDNLPSKLVKTTEVETRSAKKEIQKRDRHYIIGDILAVTNCSYYWGSINRHEAEEVSIGHSFFFKL